MKATVLAAAATLPLTVALVFVRPAAAAPAATPFGNYGITAVAAGVRTAGDVGVSGGLVTLDSGSAYVSASLDASPSSQVLAAAVEPGTLIRTIVGTVNTAAGSAVLGVKDAEAAYPGKGAQDYTTVAPTTIGPLQTTAGDGSAKAGPNSASGSALGADLAIPGLVKVKGSFSDLQLSGDKDQGHYLASASSTVSEIDIAGVVQVHGVTASSRIEGTGAKTVPSATLTIGSATVAGTPVSIDADGVHVLGQNQSAAQLKAAQATVNAALKAAGIQIHAIDVIHSVDGRSALADTGGVLVSIVTPDLPAGLTGNTFSIAFGKVTLTGISSAAYPVVTSPPGLPNQGIPGVTPPPAPTTTSGPVTTPSTPAAPPTVPTVSPRQIIVAGHRMSARTALGAFGCWQLLSLSGATLYALLDRRRRLKALEVS